MKFVLGLGWVFGVALAGMAFVTAPFPSVAEPVNRAGGARLLFSFGMRIQQRYRTGR